MRKGVAVAAVLLAALILTTSVTGCGRAKVPDVVGMRQADAVRTLQDAGYLLGNVSLVATDGVEPGMIAAQVPAAGERAKEGTKVDLAVSFTDGKRVLVPNVTGLTETTADNVAKTTGLLPAFTEQLIPKETSSPTMAPNFTLPVLLPHAFTGLRSCRRFAIFVPAPRLQEEPKMLSPT